MNLILLGPPGAGKGTQAKVLTDKRGLIQLSTGEMLREAIAAGSEIGRKVAPIMNRGELAPDDVVISVIAERIARPDCAKKGFILDGFPRTLPQAAALDDLLARMRCSLDAVVELRVDDEELIKRIAGRFTCETCGAGYHDTMQPPRMAGVCDKCGGTKFTRRADDNAESVRTRLTVYYKQTAPLIGYYFAKGKLVSVDGMGAVETIARDVSAALDKVKARAPV